MSSTVLITGANGFIGTYTPGGGPHRAAAFSSNDPKTHLNSSLIESWGSDTE